MFRLMFLVMSLVLFLIAPAAMAIDVKPTIAILRFGAIPSFAAAESGILDVLEAYGVINENERARLG